MDIKIFPWDFGEKPYWVNPENGIEWYIDKDTTKWCTRKTLNKLPKLNAVVFLVAKREGDKIIPLNRTLIDVKTNAILAEETSLEVIATIKLIC